MDDDIDDCDDEDVEGLAMMENTARGKLNSRPTISVMGTPRSRETTLSSRVEDTSEERNKTTNIFNVWYLTEMETTPDCVAYFPWV